MKESPDLETRRPAEQAVDNRPSPDSEASRLDLDAKKPVLRQFTYGLYAVTAEHAGERGVFTANWVTQVSFDPPLVAVSVERDSATLPLIQASGRFAICPFREGQRELAGNLGRPRARTGDKFAAYGLATARSAAGLPVLSDLLGYVVCDVARTVPAGDSLLIIGEVIEAAIFAAGPPLTMRDAGFRHAG
ncbi:MAG TPA: flavin reductase family protein [Thermomicrobiales bacterium]|nr:flavin reductase family protein [Thermomicrobiales bacterium]